MSFIVAIAFKGIRRCVQAAKQRAVWLSLDCINGKYLWALPTPTTFEKVDQTFIITCRNNLLNHNLPQLLIKNLISIKNGSTCEFNFKVLPFNY